MCATLYLSSSSMAIERKLISGEWQFSAHVSCEGEETVCSESLMPSTVFFIEANMKTSSFLE